MKHGILALALVLTSCVRNDFRLNPQSNVFGAKLVRHSFTDPSCGGLKVTTSIWTEEGSINDLYSLIVEMDGSPEAGRILKSSSVSELQVYVEHDFTASIGLPSDDTFVAPIDPGYTSQPTAPYSDLKITFLSVENDVVTFEYQVRLVEGGVIHGTISGLLEDNIDSEPCVSPI